MLDFYPKGPVTGQTYVPGQDPTEVLTHFDPESYRARTHAVFGNLWIQGGVRDRVFFADDPGRAPSLNKTPLVKWNRRYVYVTSTHQMLPWKINNVFETGDGAKVSGVLLHTKFLPNIAEKSQEERVRGQHFENSALYADYYATLIQGPDFWHPGSVRYEGPPQFEELGLMTRGHWVP